MDKATANRLNALARARTPAVIAAQLAAQEAGYQAEADFRKAEAMGNVPRWAEIRKSRGQGR